MNADFLKKLWESNKSIFLDIGKAVLKNLLKEHILPAAKALAARTDFTDIDDRFCEQFEVFIDKLFEEPKLLLADKNGALPGAAPAAPEAAPKA